MDQFIRFFIKKIGLPTATEVVSEATLVKYEELLPACLLTLWREHGLASFGKGIFWLVNPDDFEGIGNSWVQDFPEFSDAKIYVFGRSAFGCLYAFHVETGKLLKIMCPFGYVMTQKKASKGDVDRLQIFFSGADAKTFDVIDVDKQSLFEKALKELGPCL